MYRQKSLGNKMNPTHSLGTKQHPSHSIATKFTPSGSLANSTIQEREKSKYSIEKKN
jgi:hypothetical protein